MNTNNQSGEQSGLGYPTPLSSVDSDFDCPPGYIDSTIVRLQTCHNKMIELQQKVIDFYGEKLNNCETRMYELIGKVITPAIERLTKSEERMVELADKVLNKFVRAITPLYAKVLEAEQLTGGRLEIIQPTSEISQSETSKGTEENEEQEFNTPLSNTKELVRETTTTSSQNVSTIQSEQRVNGKISTQVISSISEDCCVGLVGALGDLASIPNKTTLPPSLPWMFGGWWHWYYWWWKSYWYSWKWKINKAIEKSANTQNDSEILKMLQSLASKGGPNKVPDLDIAGLMKTLDKIRVQGGPKLPMTEEEALAVYGGEEKPIESEHAESY